MKKLWDKPYKINLYIIILLLISIALNAIAIKSIQAIKPIATEVEVAYNTEEVKTEVQEEIVSTEPQPTEEVKTEPVSTPVEVPPAPPKQEVVQQPTPPPSRGGVQVQPSTERQVINGYVREITQRYNINAELIMSVIQTESTYNPKAKNGNCLGLMQVSSYWHRDRAARLGVTDFYNPYGNILVGVDYISELLKQYKDIRLVLMMYNMNHDTALKMYKNGQISEYARTILARAEQYKKGE